LLAVHAEQAMSDCVKGAAPDPCGRGLAHDLAGPADHFIGRPARERQQEDALGERARMNQGRQPGCQRLRFAGPGAGDDQERAGTVRGCGTLTLVERRQECQGRPV